MADVEDEALEPWTCTSFSQRVAEDSVFLDRISRHFEMLTPLQQMRIILSLVYCPPLDPPRAYLDLLRVAQESDNDLVASCAHIAWAVLVENVALHDVAVHGASPYDEANHCVFREEGLLED